MCGISGIVGKGNHEQAIKAMVKSQHHRGPDYNGTWTDSENVWLGHNRLSIIDLLPQSNQPFVCSDNRYVMVFNGEIYNYLELKEELKNHCHFHTDSDTEVLLNAYKHWGSECLSKLRGMWAFAIWDKQEKILFASRDRFGVKPFYYAIQNNTFSFCSEVKAFWSADMLPKKWNEPVLSRYLVYAHYGQPDECMFAGIKQLPGGCSLLWKDNTSTVNRWYRFEDEVLKTKLSMNAAELKEELKNKLLENIKLRLRSDVPVGFNLSGGVDSTLLFELIRTQLDKSRTKAFTFYSKDERYDETEWVKSIIGQSGFQWEKCLIQPDDIPQMAEKIQHHCDEPYSGIATLAYARTFEEARKNNYIVLLDGSGIDEQFAGYDYYTAKSDSNIQGTTTSPVRTACLEQSFLSLAQKPVVPEPFHDTLLNLQYRDTLYTKLQRDMRFNDRISMAYSTELREPFLDHTLFEFAFALPVEYKIRNGQRKAIIRDIIRDSLQSPLTEAPKRPLQTPQREWLSSNLKEWVHAQVNKGLSKYTWLKKKEVESEMKSFFEGNNENSFFIWQWVSLGMIDV